MPSDGESGRLLSSFELPESPPRGSLTGMRTNCAQPSSSLVEDRLCGLFRFRRVNRESVSSEKFDESRRAGERGLLNCAIKVNMARPQVLLLPVGFVWIDET